MLGQPRDRREPFERDDLRPRRQWKRRGQRVGDDVGDELPTVGQARTKRQRGQTHDVIERDAREPRVGVSQRGRQAPPGQRVVFGLLGRLQAWHDAGEHRIEVVIIEIAMRVTRTHGTPQAKAGQETCAHERVSRRVKERGCDGG